MSDEDDARAGDVSAEGTPAKARPGAAPPFPHDDRATVAQNIKNALADPCPVGFKYLVSKAPFAKWGAWGVGAGGDAVRRHEEPAGGAAR